MPLLTLEEHPYNAETPIPELSSGLTASQLFYVRSHFDVPRLDAAQYRLRVEGGLRDIPGLSMDELQALPFHRIAATLECAGNGRALLDPPVPGVRWGFGATSTAHFGGASLHHVLDRAGFPDSAQEVLFVGADSGEVEPARRIAFERSLPLSLARHPDTILAWEMNGEPLTPFHGFPLRLLVPRWYAVASVKWLTRIRFLTEPFRGHYQSEKYCYVGDTGTRENSPVTTMRVRALIARPAEGEIVPRRPLEIAGVAWSGDAAIVDVQVSVDGGASWRQAELAKPLSEYAWTPWRLAWTPASPGEHWLLSRATDAAGNTQPLGQRWNAQGYGNNAVQRVRVRVD